MMRIKNNSQSGNIEFKVKYKSYNGMHFYLFLYALSKKIHTIAPIFSGSSLVT